MFRTLNCLLAGAAFATAAVAGNVATGTLEVTGAAPAALADRSVILGRMLTPSVYRAHFGQSVPSGQPIQPQDEKWVMYIPPRYDGAKAYGLLVWISPGERADVPYGWQTALDSHDIIYIAAERSGNEQPVYSRRVPLALTGYAYAVSHYRIDKNRVYIGGFSGGGVVASHIASAFGDIFTGGLFVSTADGIDIEPSNGVKEDRVPVPQKSDLARMRTQGRYMFTVGEDDSINAMIVQRAFDSYRALCITHIRLLAIPHTGHENLSRRWLDYSLNFLDSPGSGSGASFCVVVGVK